MDIEQHNEKYIKEAIKTIRPEQPSPAFLHQVMQKIEASEKATAYTPLISRKGWIAAAAVVLMLIICAFYFGNDTTLLKQINTEKLSGYINFNMFNNITLSTNARYGLLFTALIILLQIPILKFRHDKAMWGNNS